MTSPIWTNSLATQLNAEGLLAFSRLISPEARELPGHRQGRFPGPANSYVAFEISATAITYNPKVVTTPPTSWNDLFDPKYKGRIAIGDITGTSGVQFLMAVNKMRGGTLDNMEPGFAAMKELADNSVTLYTQADQLVSLFQRGDIVIAPWYPRPQPARRSTRGSIWRSPIPRKARSASSRCWSSRKARQISILR